MSINFSNNYFSVKEIEKHLIVFEIKGVEATDEEFDAFVRSHQQIIELPYRVGILYEAHQIKFIKADHRIKVGNWMKKNTPIIQEKVIAVSYHLHSIMGKIILNGVFLVQKPCYEYEIFSNGEKAKAWLNEKLGKNVLV